MNKLEIMKNRFYWDEETLQYFKNNKSVNSKDIENYVKYECHLEDGETIKMLVDDLITQINNYGN